MEATVTQFICISAALLISTECTTDCVGRETGQYPHCEDCKGFVICFPAPNIYSCPGALLYNRETATCDLPESVNNCV